MSEGRSASSDSSDDEEYIPPECEEEVSEESEEDISDDEIDSVPVAKKESKEIEVKDREKIWNEFLKEVQPAKAKDEPNKDTSSQKTESNSTSIRAQSSSSKAVPTELPKPATGLSIGLKRPAPPSSSRASELLKKLKSSTLLSGAPKMTTLEKSKLDWESFKQKEGIADDLKIHNKGKNGYVERKAFEARTQEREYQLLKEARLKNMRR